jgi:DNA-binding NarL/FixJ family response regulator
MRGQLTNAEKSPQGVKGRKPDLLEDAGSEGTEKKALTGKVLIVQADRLGSGDMRKAVHDVFPDVQVSVVRSGSAAVSAVQDGQFHFAILGFSTADLVWLDDLPGVLKALGSTPAMIISGRHAPRTFRVLSKFRSVSIFDPVSQGPRDLRLAMEAMIEGRRYLSPSIQEVMRDGREMKPELLLSRAEEKILSVIGEGIGNEEAALRLSLTVATLQTHRKNIMRKLDVHSSGELVQIAIKHGYVTRTLDGSLRAGIIMILSQMIPGDEQAAR